MEKDRIIIGTRGSRLALVQAGLVKEKIMHTSPGLEVSVKIIKTKGDIILDSPLYEIGDKGLFVKEIDQELIEGTIDIAVHSLKDVPADLPDPLILGGVLERGEVRDVLVSRDNKRLCDLTQGARIATSSLRRKAQLLLYKSGLKIIEIRGNIDTRIKKMDDAYCEAVVLAGAGVVRAGYKERITEYIDPEIMIPAACQGIIGITVKKDSGTLVKVLEKISCKDTMISALSERVFLRTIQGGCKVPVGCFTTVTDKSVIIKGFLSNPDGSIFVKKQAQGTVQESPIIAESLAESILADGGREILAGIRNGK